MKTEGDLIILAVLTFPQTPAQSCDQECLVNQQYKTKSMLPCLTCLLARYEDPISTATS